MEIILKDKIFHICGFMLQSSLVIEQLKNSQCIEKLPIFLGMSEINSNGNNLDIKKRAFFTINFTEK